MTRNSWAFTGLLVALALAAPHDARAQMVQLPVAPGVMLPPPPPPPPPPRIDVPVVPKMDAPLPLPHANIQPRGSFGDRVVRCLDEGAARGLNSTERSLYAGTCANN